MMDIEKSDEFAFNHFKQNFQVSVLLVGAALEIIATGSWIQSVTGKKHNTTAPTRCQTWSASLPTKKNSLSKVLLILDTVESFL